MLLEVLNNEEYINYIYKFFFKSAFHTMDENWISDRATY